MIAKRIAVLAFLSVVCGCGPTPYTHAWRCDIEGSVALRAMGNLPVPENSRVAEVVRRDANAWMERTFPVGMPIEDVRRAARDLNLHCEDRQFAGEYGREASLGLWCDPAEFDFYCRSPFSGISWVFSIDIRYSNGRVVQSYFHIGNYNAWSL